MLTHVAAVSSHPPTYYLPPQDVNQDLLERTSRSSFCEVRRACPPCSIANANALPADRSGKESRPTSTSFLLTGAPRS